MTGRVSVSGATMGLFDLFSKGDPAEKKRSAALKKLTNMYYQKIDRMVAAETCAEMAREGDAEAVLVMLRRFEHLAPNTTNDREEKEHVVNLLVDLGDVAAPHVQEYVRRTDKPVYWPMLVLDHVLDGDDMEAFHASLLEQTDNDYHRDPERKLGLVQSAGTRASLRMQSALLPFVEDHHEDVRNAAVDALVRVTIALTDGVEGHDEITETALAALLPRLAGDEESLRVRGRICDEYAKRGWSLQGRAADVQRAVPNGYRVTGDRIVKAG
jgi:hypothetical protein